MNHPNITLFLKYISDECKRHGVTLILKDTKYIIGNDGAKFGGWFDYENKELHCSFPSKLESKYISLLSHEFCHMQQWILQTPAWVEMITKESSEKFWQYMGGQKVKSIKTHVRVVQRMEAECERMSAQLLADWDLGINIAKYIQTANSYLLLYSILPETRLWCHYAPYKRKVIWQQMPSDKILNSFKMTDSLRELYIQQCYKKRTIKELNLYQTS